MRTLDRYIIRQFLINFAILALVLFALVVLVDMTINFDYLLEAGRIRVRAGQFDSMFVATLYSIGDYYYPMGLMLFVFLSGLLVTAAMGFTLWGLTRNGEIVAMVAGGISMYRVAAPILVVGGLINLAALPLQEYVIPDLAGKLARGPSQIAYDTVKTFELRLAHDEHGDLISGEYDPATQTIRRVTILDRDSDTGAVIHRVSWDQAHWELDQKTQAWGWRQVLPAGKVPAAGEPGFFPSDLSPQVLLARRATIYPRLLSLQELQSMADNPAANGSLIRQIMHARFSLIVVNVLVLAMGLPLFLLREPANLMFQAVKAAGLAVGVWAAAVVVMQTSTGELNPYTSAWLPVVICLPLAAWRLQTVKT